MPTAPAKDAPAASKITAAVPLDLVENFSLDGLGLNQLGRIIIRHPSLARRGIGMESRRIEGIPPSYHCNSCRSQATAEGVAYNDDPIPPQT